METKKPRKWTARMVAQLGKASDRVVGERLGLSLSVVNRERRERGIPSQKNKPWPADVVARLGTVPDAEIAEELGISRQAVAVGRSKLGIPPCHPKHGRSK